MNLPAWLILNIFVALMTILLLPMAIHQSSKQALHGRPFLYLLITILCLIIFDSISRIEPTSELTFYFIRNANLCQFALDPVAYYFAMRYLGTWMADSWQESKAWNAFLLSFAIANFLFVLYSECFQMHWFYSYVGYEYVRGPYFILRSAILLSAFIISEIYVLFHIRKVYHQYRIPLILFPIVPLIGGLSQAFIYGLSSEYASMILSCYMLLLYVQLQDIDYDYLTNVVNRNRIDLEMEDRITRSESAKRPLFSVFSIDLDYFKSINDSLGHMMGDEALCDFTAILQKTFQKRDVIGRIGGDEFLVLTHITDPDELAFLRRKLDSHLSNFNEHTTKPYKLYASVGIATYDPTAGYTPEEFRQLLDHLLYDEKEAHHASIHAEDVF